MPQFDVLRINQKHLAKVNVARSNMVFDNDKTYIFPFVQLLYLDSQMKDSNNFVLGLVYQPQENLPQSLRL